MNFDAATKWLESRVYLRAGKRIKNEEGITVQAPIGTYGIAKQFPSSVKSRAFFSAKVMEGRILEKLRKISDSYSRGDLGLSDARVALKDFLRHENYIHPGKPEGVSEEDWVRSGSISNLASTARLNLVLRQNAAMAAAVGRYEVSRNKDIEKRWPCWRYIAGHNPRPSHAALDGMVFLKSDPIWRKIYPPWDFNCNCDVEDAEIPEGGADNKRPEDIQGNENGYEFDPANAFTENNAGELEPMTRFYVLDEMKKAVKTGKMRSVGCITAPITRGFPKTPLSPNVEKSLKNMESHYVNDVQLQMKSYGIDPEKMLDWLQVNQAWKSNGVSPRNVPESVKNSLGQFGEIALAQLPNRFAKSSNLPMAMIKLDQRAINNIWSNHKEMFANEGEILKAITSTICNPNARFSVGFFKNKRGVNIVPTIFDEETGARSVLEFVDDNEKKYFRIISIHFSKEKYDDIEALLR